MQHDEGIKYIYLNRRLYSFLPQNKREIPEGDALITEGDTKFKANDFEVREIAQKMRTPASWTAAFNFWPCLHPYCTCSQGALDCFTRAKAAFEASDVAQVQAKKVKKKKPKVLEIIYLSLDTATRIH